MAFVRQKIVLSKLSKNIQVYLAIRNCFVAYGHCELRNFAKCETASFQSFLPKISMFLGQKYYNQTLNFSVKYFYFTIFKWEKKFLFLTPGFFLFSFFLVLSKSWLQWIGSAGMPSSWRDGRRRVNSPRSSWRRWKWRQVKQRWPKKGFVLEN